MQTVIGFTKLEGLFIYLVGRLCHKREHEKTANVLKHPIHTDAMSHDQTQSYKKFEVHRLVLSELSISRTGIL